MYLYNIHQSTQWCVSKSFLGPIHCLLFQFSPRFKVVRVTYNFFHNRASRKLMCTSTNLKILKLTIEQTIVVPRIFWVVVRVESANLSNEHFTSCHAPTEGIYQTLPRSLILFCFFPFYSFPPLICTHKKKIACIGFTY